MTTTFLHVEIDMDKFADCTRHGAQSAAKLYNQKFVQGTRDAEIVVVVS